MGRREPSTKGLHMWQDEIRKNGIKRITARILLGAFGYKKRGPRATDHIKQWLGSQDPPIYIYGLKYARSLNEAISLSRVEQTQIGRFVEKEKVLMDRFQEHIMPQLGLQNPCPGFRPDGCQYELDFLCEDGQGRTVVVELKREDGEKKVVEQVVAYIRSVRKLPRCKHPRGLIITGYADLHTRRALEELEPQYHVDRFIYSLTSDNARVHDHIHDDIQIQQIHVRPAHAATQQDVGDEQMQRPVS